MKIRKLVLNGHDAECKAHKDGSVSFRYLDDAVWFSLDGSDYHAQHLLQRLSPAALRAIAEAKESLGLVAPRFPNVNRV